MSDLNFRFEDDDEQPRPVAIFTSKPVEFLRWLGIVLLTGIVISAPWMYASVYQWAQLYLLIFSVVGLGTLWFMRGLQTFTRPLPAIVIPVLLGVGYIGLQLLPLGYLGPLSGLASHHQQQDAEFRQPVEGELFVVAGQQDDSSSRLTMDLDRTQKYWNLLVLGLVVLILAEQLFHRSGILFFLSAVTLNGAAIAAFGIVRVLSGDNRANIYGNEGFENVTFGPFVNPNNATSYLVMCLAAAIGLMATMFRTPGGEREELFGARRANFLQQVGFEARVFVASLEARHLIVILSVILTAVGVVLAGSRGGLVGFGVGGLFTAVYLCWKGQSWTPLVPFAFMAALVLAAVYFSGQGDKSLEEIGSLSDAGLLENESRIQNWSENMPAVIDYAPWGAGLGSYLHVHRANRQTVEGSAFHFAENQYFQTLVEAGAPGVILLAIAMLLLIGSVMKVWKGQSRFPRLGFGVLAALLIPSQFVSAAFDFGLFIPANMLLMAALTGVLTSTRESRDRPGYRNWLSVVALVITLLAACQATFLCWNYVQVESQLHASPQVEDFESLTLQETDRRIDKLQSVLTRSKDAIGYNQLAELYIHRFRLKLHDSILQQLGSQPTEIATQRLWAATHPVIVAQQADRAFANDQLFQENLAPAIRSLQASRVRSPLQAHVHLLMGQCLAVSGATQQQAHMERCLKLAPMHPPTLLGVGSVYLLGEDSERAVQILKQTLQFNPKLFSQVMQLASGKFSNREIADRLIPDDPALLVQFSEQINGTDQEILRSELLARSLELLAEQTLVDGKALRLKLKIEVQLEDFEAAVDTIQELIRYAPQENRLYHRLAILQANAGDFAGAINTAGTLVRRDGREKHRGLLRQIEQLRQQHLQEQLEGNLDQDELDQ